MESRTLISVEEYLRTSYRPDCDYVDGEVVERNLGEHDHSSLQKKLILFLGIRERQWNIEVLPEQRVQVGATRFRVPDVCAVLGRTEEKILTKPPFLCIEILSPEDRLNRVKQRVDDYLAMGVPYVWVLDPATRCAFAVTPELGWREVKDGVLRTENPALEVPLEEIFGGPENPA
jgi:Uma2 family endonuclease